MGQWIDLTAADGFRMAAYRADPAGQGKPRGGLVVVQEVFMQFSASRLSDRMHPAGSIPRCKVQQRVAKPAQWIAIATRFAPRPSFKN